MKAIIIILMITLSSCMTDNNNARRVLESEGYYNIRFTGYKCFACSDDDVYATGFTANNRNGNLVSVTVCAGVFKRNTIRLD